MAIEGADHLGLHFQIGRRGRQVVVFARLKTTRSLVQIVFEIFVHYAAPASSGTILFVPAATRKEAGVTICGIRPERTPRRAQDRLETAPMPSARSRFIYPADDRP